MGTGNRPAGVYDVLIVGGGMVGGLLACALGGSSIKVAVLERQPPAASKEKSPRVSAITPASRIMLETLGIWTGAGITDFGAVRAMRVWDQTDHGAIHFNAADIGESCLAYIVENAALVAAMHRRLQEFTNIQVLSPVEIADLALSDGMPRLTLHDGRTLSGRLLVGADGPDSIVRHAAGISLRLVNLDQKSIVANVASEQPHRDTAYQRFLSTGPLAFLPMADPHQSSVVWSVDNARADALHALDDTAFAAELSEAMGGCLGAVHSVGPRALFPLNLSHASRYVAPGVAVIGDAAHTVHPLAGQGVNLGFLDAATLAEVVGEAATTGKDIGALHVLRRYERWRKGENLGMVTVTGAFRYLFGNNLPVVRDVRAFGLRFADEIRPLKNFLMRRACGLGGDLPRIAQRVPR